MARNSMHLLVVAALLAYAMLSLSPLPAEAADPDTPTTLDEAVAGVKKMMTDGRSRSDIANWVMNVADNRVANMNSMERMSLWENWIPIVGPSMGRNVDFDKWRELNNFNYKDTAEWVWASGVGQCSEHSALVYYILKTAGVPGNVRIMNSGGHEFTSWGLKDGADPNNTTTWGDDAVVVDSWLGKVLGPADAAANKWVGNGGKNIMSDQTIAFDKEAKAWTLSPENEAAQSSSEDCFIATAAYGTALAEDIRVLRHYRDEVLMSSGAGRAAVALYYRESPPLANWIAGQPLARGMVRERLLKPLILLLRGTAFAWQGSS